MPALGNVLLEDLTPRHIQQFINFMAEAAHTRTGQPLSDRSKQFPLVVLKNALNYAATLEYVDGNPAQFVKVAQAKSKQRTPMGPDEIALFLEGLRDEEELASRNTRPRSGQYPLILQLILATGLRLGEVLALRPADIDFESGSINVQRTTENIGGRTIVTDDVKTPTSRRTVVLPPA